MSMYKKFFGLHDNPFNVNPDPRFLCFTPQTRRALAELKYGINNHSSFILLTGEVGTGKTTLVNCLLDWLHQQKTPAAFLFNCHLSSNHLLEFILSDFKIPYDARSKGNLLLCLIDWLVERNRAGETPVLILDEAQGLRFELLEEIRLLLNMETPSKKLLQIVLVGQPELEQKLLRPEMRQIRQRITTRCKTSSLTCEETHRYIEERLQIAGATDRIIFDSDAMDAAYRYSGGIPRVLNLICENALIAAYVNNVRTVSASIVEEAARDFSLGDCSNPVSRGGTPAPPYPVSVSKPSVWQPEPRAGELALEPVMVASEPQFTDLPIPEMAAIAASTSSMFHADSAKSGVPPSNPSSYQQSPAPFSVALAVNSTNKISTARSESMATFDWTRALDLRQLMQISQQQFQRTILAGKMSMRDFSSQFARLRRAYAERSFFPKSQRRGVPLGVSLTKMRAQFAARTSKLYATFLRLACKPVSLQFPSARKQLSSLRQK